MSLEGKHVYVLDDDPMNLAVITAILKRNGAKVYTDYWGTHTVSQMKHLPHLDLILLDLNLARTSLSGYDVYDQIRGDPSLAGTPIIIVTAADPDLELKRAQDKGFNGFISKPLDHRLFAEQLQSVLDGEKVWIVR